MNEPIREERVVRGDMKHGRRPHVIFMGVRYSSQVLANSPGLIGRRISLVIDPRKILALEAFDESGSPVGTLTMTGGGHLRRLKSIEERRELLRQQRSRSFSHNHENDADLIGKYLSTLASAPKRQTNDLRKGPMDCAMQALLEKHPKIAGQVMALATAKPSKTLHQIHFAMLNELRDKGLQDDDYPFMSHDLGMNALRQHLDALHRKIAR